MAPQGRKQAIKTAGISGLDIEPPPLHPAQQEIFDDESRFRVLSCGRRFGKTMLCALICILYMLVGKRVWWVAPTYGTAGIGWREIKAIARQIKRPDNGDPLIEVAESLRTVSMPDEWGGGFVSIKSADQPDNLRGEGLDLVVLEECAFIAEAAWTQAIRPMLADRKGHAIFISTPAGRNWFWRLWNQGDPANPHRRKGWRSWQLPTSANPYIDPQEIEDAKQDMPELVFRQEHLAEFIEDGAGVFRYVDRAVNKALWQHRGIPEHRYVMGIDLGRKVDFTAATLWDVSEGKPKMVFVDHFNDSDWNFQCLKILAIVERFHPAIMMVDQTGLGDPVFQQLQRAVMGFNNDELKLEYLRHQHQLRDYVVNFTDSNRPAVMGFIFTSESKADLIEQYALAYEREILEICDHKRLLVEHKAYTMETTPTGLRRYSAPDGEHDDLVIAAALGYKVCPAFGGHQILSQWSSGPRPDAGGPSASAGILGGSFGVRPNSGNRWSW